MVLAHDITKGDRTRDVQISENITFETMLLAPSTLQGLRRAGFYKPSPIQLYGIPIGKCGFAKSGTGKTAVFSIIALEKLDFGKGLQVVILTPTREIAAQIYDVLLQIGSHYKDLKVEVVMGGLPFQDDIQKFRKTVHIVVGSPGRLKHLIQHNHIETTAVRLLVLDEADKLMEKSFQTDIRYIHTVLPKQKQVIMSSATYSESARTFINNYVQNANHVCPDSDTVLLGITQKVSFVKFHNNIVKHIQDRFKELLHILVKIQFKQCLVFCNYQARVSEVHKLLKKEKWPSQQLSGNQEQIDRLDALKTLQQYKCRILVSTDLAARGIDASNIDLVVNFEPPYEWQTYLHRIGRAGRFGSYGLAITILSEGIEEQRFKDIFKSMDLSIKMKNLWTDKEFDLDTSDASAIHSKFPSEPKPSIEFSDVVSYQAVWEVLCSQSNEINTIETFENLCKSQEKSENENIETFSELIASAENNHLKNEEKYLFKHIEMRKLPSIIMPCKEKTLQKNILVNELNKGDNAASTIEMCVEGVKINNCNMGNTSKELKEVLPNSVANLNDNIQNTTESITGVNTIKFEPHSINDNLLDLGLPTMFSSSKANKMRMEKNKQTTANKTDNVNKEIYIHTSQLYSDKTVLKNKQNVNNCDGLDNNPSHDTNIKKQNWEKKANNDWKKHLNKDKSISDTSFQDTYDKLEYQEHVQNYGGYHSRKFSQEKNDKTKKYFDWYNQLKFNMIQIEQAFYIDEMSKT